MKLQEIGTIEEINTLAEGMLDFRLRLPKIAALARPGQFLHILCGDHTLRRPISICDCDPEKGIVRMVFEIRGEGTAWLADRKTGDSLDVLGPIGHGFDLLPEELSAAGHSKPFEYPVFIGGGIGVPPLLYAARLMKNPITILGFRNRERVILADEFARLGETLVTTEDGSAGIKGFVTAPLEEWIKAGKADILYACGPTPMLKSIQKLARAYRIPCQLSLEQRMACGVGACLGCACKTHKQGKEQYSHVCKEGPVFWSEEVCFDE